MKTIKLAVGSTGVLLFCALAFQNCGKFEVMPVAFVDSVIPLNLPKYKVMTSEEAQALVRPNEQSCASLKEESSNFSHHTQGTALTVEGDQYMMALAIPSVQGLGNLTVFVASQMGSKCLGGTGTKCGGEIVQGNLGAMLGTITDFTGNILLCGISVESISKKTFGNIVIEDGSARSISGFKGNLIILGGVFPSDISDFDGNVVVKSPEGQYSGRTYLSGQ
jgi:hypothetical protein